MVAEVMDWLWISKLVSAKFYMETSNLKKLKSMKIKNNIKLNFVSSSVYGFHRKLWINLIFLCRV
jgi:hypothetical protein